MLTTDHTIPIEELCKKFGSDINKGLSEDQASCMVKEYGLNKLTKLKTFSWYGTSLRIILSIFWPLLSLIAVLSILSYWFTLSTLTKLILIFVLVFMGALTAYFTYIKQSKYSTIKSEYNNILPNSSIVIRDGFIKKISSSSVVPGDIVKLMPGDKVPADVRIIEANSLKVENCILLGEKKALYKKVESSCKNLSIETENIAFLGTTVVQDIGKGIIIKVGDNNFIMSIPISYKTTEQLENIIRIEINNFVNFISVTALLFGLILFLSSVNAAEKYDIIKIIVDVIETILANVPEGFLIAITITLTIKAKRIANYSKKSANLQLNQLKNLPKPIIEETKKSEIELLADRPSAGKEISELKKSPECELIDKKAEDSSKANEEADPSKIEGIQGLYKKSNQAVYENELINGLQEGYGKETGPDNSVYQGYFSKGKKHGEGTQIFEDQSIYTGTWADGKINGKGTYTWIDGRQYNGDWKDGTMHGKGTFTWPDGRRYEGEYQNDVKHGYGVFFFPNQKMYKGYWENGKQHGEGTVVSSDGTEARGIWEKGKRLNKVIE